jgi:hypothetical protein
MKSAKPLSALMVENWLLFSGFTWQERRV